MLAGARGRLHRRVRGADARPTRRTTSTSGSSRSRSSAARRNLGEALRRIAEGAAMIRSKGEAGTGERRRGRPPHALDPRRDPRLGIDGRGRALHRGQEPSGPVRAGASCAENGRLPVVTFTAGGIATPADAALMMQLGADGVFVGSGIFKSGDPAATAARDRQGDDALRRPADRGRGLVSASARRWRQGDRRAGPSRACSRRAAGSAPADRRPRASGRLPRALPRASRVGRTRSRCGTPADLEGLDGARDPRRRVDDDRQAAAGLRPRGADLDPARRGGPIFGTCAGMIVLAAAAVDGRPDQRSLGLIDLDVRRNGYGRQVRSSRRRSGSRARTARCTACSSARRGSSGSGRAWRCVATLDGAPVAAAPGLGHGGVVPSGADAATGACTRGSPRRSMRRGVASERDVRSLQVVDDQAQEGRRRTPSAASSSRSSRARSSWRQARAGRDPEANTTLAGRDREGALLLDAEGQHRARDRARRRRRRGRRSLRGDRLRGLRARAASRSSSRRSPTTETAPPPTCARSSRSTAAQLGTPGVGRVEFDRKGVIHVPAEGTTEDDVDAGRRRRRRRGRRASTAACGRSTTAPTELAPCATRSRRTAWRSSRPSSSSSRGARRGSTRTARASCCG